jgi:hypothetical protein
MAFGQPLPHSLGFIVSVQDGPAYRLDQTAACLILEQLHSLCRVDRRVSTATMAEHTGLAGRDRVR